MEIKWKKAFMRKYVLFIIVFNLFLTDYVFGQELDLKVYGVQINVTDLKKAADFYCNKLGFEISKKTKQKIQLKSDVLLLYLEKVTKLRKTIYNKESQTILVFQTNNLDSALTVFEQKGIEIVEGKRENGVGCSIKFRDPFGNVHSLLEQSKFPVPEFKEPKVYNVGYYISSLDIAKDFYCTKLNFQIRTTNYLPALPLNHQDSSFAFVLHERSVESTKLTLNDTQVMIIFSTNDLQKSIEILKQQGVSIINYKLLQESNYLYFLDPFGNIGKISEIETKLY